MRDDQFAQILRAINDVRDDLKEFKNEMNKRWDENDKRWEQNDKRWEENERRWEENERRWEENERRWNEYNKRWDENEKKWAANQIELNKIYEKIEQRYKDTCGIFDAYEKSVENMYQDNRRKIIAIQKRLKMSNA